MPFCPKCRFEYVAEVKRCPTCGAELVEARPEARELSEVELEQVLLCTVEGKIHAELLRAELEAQGIPARLQTGWSYDPLLGAVGAPPPPLGSTEGGLVAIFVHRADEERARVVYHDLEEVAAVEGEEEPEEENEE